MASPFSSRKSSVICGRSIAYQGRPVWWSSTLQGSRSVDIPSSLGPAFDGGLARAAHPVADVVGDLADAVAGVLGEAVRLAGRLAHRALDAARLTLAGDQLGRGAALADLGDLPSQRVLVVGVEPHALAAAADRDVELLARGGRQRHRALGDEHPIDG